MIVANASRDDGGGKMMILGLTAGNLERLMRGEPIHVRREVHGEGVPEGLEILMMYGIDEQSLVSQLKPFLGECEIRERPGLSDETPGNS